MTVIGPPTRRVTIRDVAREAGVSVTTVSNVMNGRVASMTPETLARVEETIRELGYRRNANARGLVRREAHGVRRTKRSPTKALYDVVAREERIPHAPRDESDDEEQ